MSQQEYSIQPAQKLELTEECHNYRQKHHVPWDIQKSVLSLIQLKDTIV